MLTMQFDTLLNAGGPFQPNGFGIALTLALFLMLFYYAARAEPEQVAQEDDKQPFRHFCSGTPGTPSARHDLTAIDPVVGEHILLALQSGYNETRYMLKLSEPMLRQTIRQANLGIKCIGGIGLGDPDGDIDELRSALRSRRHYLSRLLKRFRSMQSAGVDHVCGLTDGQYRTLGEVVEAGKRVAGVFARLNAEQAQTAYGYINDSFGDMDAPGLEHFSPYLDDLPGFMRERERFLNQFGQNFLF